MIIEMIDTNLKEDAFMQIDALNLLRFMSMNISMVINKINIFYLYLLAVIHYQLKIHLQHYLLINLNVSLFH